MPLYLRITLLFLLNVSILLGALAWTAHRQMQSGLQSLLGTIVGANLQDAAEDIHKELKENPSAKWPDILSDFEKKHRVLTGVFRLPGTHVAGSLKIFPTEVSEGLFPRFGGKDRVPGMPPHGPPDFDSNGKGPGTMRRIPANAPTTAGGRDFPKGLIRTGHPLRYWAVAALPPMPSDRRGPPDRIAFAISTESILICPLLFDSRPWMLGIAAALLVSCMIWFPFVRAITSKLRETTHATRQMASGNLSVRIRDNRRDEIGQLASSVNTMAAQLESYVQGQRRFTRDIAHELCSPISRMQAASGVLENATFDARERQYVEAIDSELQHMSHLVQELLHFAKVDEMKDPALGPVVLDPLVQMVIDRECGTEADPRIVVQVPNDLIVTADSTLLGRAIGNVLRNALRYAGNAALIEINATRIGRERIHLTISDTGIGVPADSLSHLFEAFYRTDEARSPGQGGAGLGLAIARQCTEACGGIVTAGHRSPHGLVIKFDLGSSTADAVDMN